MLSHLKIYFNSRDSSYDPVAAYLKQQRSCDKMCGPIDVTVFEKWIFWSNSSDIYKISRHNTSESERILTQENIGSVHVIHPLSQPASINICQKRRVKCSHLCVPISQLDTKCLCPNNTNLTKDNSTCEHSGITKEINTSRKSAVQSEKNLKDNQDNEKLVIILLVSSVGGSIFLLLVVSWQNDRDNIILIFLLFRLD